MYRLMMVGVDAGGIARDAVIRSAAAGFVSFVKREFLALVHPGNMNRIQRFFMVAHIAGIPFFVCF